MSDSIKIGVIGGSGLYGLRGLSDLEERVITTPFGTPSDAVVLGTLAGVRVAFISRHGRGHRYTPSEVNYRANIFALKTLGVERVLGISACGSLREHIPPGDVVVPNQLVDLTKGRATSFFSAGLVAHISVADPFCQELSTHLADAVQASGGAVHRGGRFVTIEGPRFSTKAESHLYRTWGLDIIGMTTSPEAFLAREAELCYAVMAHVTDYDVWHTSAEPVTVDMVVQQLKRNATHAEDALTEAVRLLAEAPRNCTCTNALKDAFITDRNRIPAEMLATLHPLVGKYF